MSQEFEDRESELSAPDNLGELPTGISRERNELYRRTRTDAPPHTPIGTPRPAGFPSDVNAEARALGDGKGKLGSPIIPVSVTSVYDARPVNARDWTITAAPTITPDDALSTTETVTLDYTVPLGFTGVLRGFQFVPKIEVDFDDGITTNPFFSLTTLSILINNIVQPDFNGLAYGAGMDAAQEIFIVASELQKITLSVTFNENYRQILKALTIETTPIFLIMYGNNLLTRGLPTAFEVGTQDTSGATGEIK